MRYLTVLRVSQAAVLALWITACDETPTAVDTSPPGGEGLYPLKVLGLPRAYGDDANGNGVVDMPNSVEYVQAPLPIRLDGTRLAESYPGGGGSGTTTGSWRWTFEPGFAGAVPQGVATLPITPSSVSGLTATNDGAKLVTYTTSPNVTVMMFEGEWSVELARVDATGTPIYWKTRPLTINDVLVVQLGDSYSSGEGAPDRSESDGFWGDDGTGGNGTHASAHRSSNTWGSVYAQNLQGLAGLLFLSTGIPTSFTYINLAQSGALINEVDGQLDQMAALIGPRKVDRLLISIGGNDAGFASAVAAYLLREPIAFGMGLLGPSFDDIEDAIADGDWTGDSFTDAGSVLVELFDFALPHKFTNVRGLDGLAAGYQHLATEFQAHGIEPASVRILKYPDPLSPLHTDPNAVCPEPILTAVASVFGRELEVEPDEQSHARTHLIRPINQRISASAAQFGWTVVNAESVMRGHAICQDDRMVLRFNESEEVQGDHKGVLHPNKEGYKAIADVVDP